MIFLEASAKNPQTHRKPSIFHVNNRRGHILSCRRLLLALIKPIWDRTRILHMNVSDQARKYQISYLIDKSQWQWWTSGLSNEPRVSLYEGNQFDLLSAFFTYLGMKVQYKWLWAVECYSYHIIGQLIPKIRLKYKYRLEQCSTFLQSNLCEVSLYQRCNL